VSWGHANTTFLVRGIFCRRDRGHSVKCLTGRLVCSGEALHSVAAFLNSCNDAVPTPSKWEAPLPGEADVDTRTHTVTFQAAAFGARCGNTQLRGCCSMFLIQFTCTKGSICKKWTSSPFGLWTATLRLWVWFGERTIKY